MDILEMVGKYLPYIGGAAAVLAFVEGFIDNVVRPRVQASASKRDDEILEKYVDGPLGFVSDALAFVLRAGRRK